MSESSAAPFTAQDALQEAQGTLAAWINGYTEPRPGSDSPQRRIRVADSGDGWLTICVEGARYVNEPDRYFRIGMTALELDPQGGATDHV